MQAMEPIKRFSGDQYLHRKSDEYRSAISRKIQAYHVRVQVGVVVQGILQFLSLMAKQEVWAGFGSWIRAIRPEVPPSEQLVATSMLNSLNEFLNGTEEARTLVKFIRTKHGNLEDASSFRKTGS